MARVSDISRAVRDMVRRPFSARHPGGGVIHRAQAEAHGAATKRAADGSVRPVRCLRQRRPGAPTLLHP